MKLTISALAELTGAEIAVPEKFDEAKEKARSIVSANNLSLIHI